MTNQEALQQLKNSVIIQKDRLISEMKIYAMQNKNKTDFLDLLYYRYRDEFEYFRSIAMTVPKQLINSDLETEAWLFTIQSTMEVIKTRQEIEADFHIYHLSKK